MFDAAARGDADPHDRATGSGADSGGTGRVEPDGRTGTGGSGATVGRGKREAGAKFESLSVAELGQPDNHYHHHQPDEFDQFRDRGCIAGESVQRRSNNHHHHDRESRGMRHRG